MTESAQPRPAPPPRPQRVAVDVADNVAHVRLARPAKMNALDQAMFQGIADAIDALRKMREVRAVVLSGEGRAFCAGLDLAAMAAGGSGNDVGARYAHDANLVQYVAWGWRTLPMPVIAAAHGVAYGGGFQILSGADIRIVHPATRCAIMEVKWGLIPDMAGYPLWRGNVRDDVVRELTYSHAEFSGERAVELGFATHADDDPVAAAMTLARTIAAKNPHAIRAAKRLSNATADMPDDALLLAETREQLALLRSPNQVEAVMAAMAGRDAVFADECGAGAA